MIHTVHVERCPALAQPCAVGPDLIVRWTDWEPNEPLSLVLHLHGYSMEGPAMRLDHDKLAISGLDLMGSAGHLRATLAFLPRGRFFGGRSGFGYAFDHLCDKSVVDAIVRSGFDAVEQVSAVRPPMIGRRVLTAHSGGAAHIAGVATAFSADQILIFDGLYSETPWLSDWAAKRLQDPSPRARDANEPALRVIYVPGTGTENASLSLQTALRRLLRELDASPQVASRFRVEPVEWDHFTMAQQFGGQLLADPGTDLRYA